MTDSETPKIISYQGRKRQRSSSSRRVTDGPTDGRTDGRTAGQLAALFPAAGDFGGSTHVDHPGRVAPAQVEQHGRLVEVRQHGHVFDHVILGRVHLLHVTVLHRQSLRRPGGHGRLSVAEHRRKGLSLGLFSNTFVHLPVFGFNDDFVAAALSDLDLDVGLFLIRDPGSLLP